MSTPATTLGFLASRSQNEPIGTIALPLRDHVNGATVMSLMRIDWSFLRPGENVDIEISMGSVLTLQRNDLVQKMRGQWLLFIDDDMVFEPQSIGQIVDTFYELDAQFAEPVIVGGLCFRRAAPYYPTMYRREAPDHGGYRVIETWDKEVVEVEATGAAFLLVPVTALEAIAETPQPPFEVRMQQGRPPGFFRWQGIRGEDLQFCQDFKAAGGRIFVDTRIEIRHVSEVQVGKEHYLREMALRSEEEEAACRTANTLLGLPTLAAEAAAQKLGWQSSPIRSISSSSQNSTENPNPMKLTSMSGVG